MLNPSRFQYKHPALENFDQFYAENMQADVLNHEGLRQKYLLWGIVLTVSTLPLCLALAWWVHSKDPRQSTDIFKFLWPVPLLVCAGLVWRLRRRMKAFEVKSISDYLGWQHREGTLNTKLVHLLASYDLLTPFENVTMDDRLGGFHKEWPFWLYEIKLTELVSDDPRRPDIGVVYQGFVLAFKTRFISDAVTRISFNADVSETVKTKLPHQGVVAGKLDVRSSERHALDTALCPRFRAALMELSETFSGADMECLFFGNDVFISFKSTDLFEIGALYKGQTALQRTQIMLNEFSDILQILDIVLKRRTCLQTGTTDFPAFRGLNYRADDPPCV